MTSGWAEGRDEDRDAGSEVEFESAIDRQIDLDDERLLREVPPHHGV